MSYYVVIAFTCIKFEIIWPTILFKTLAEIRVHEVNLYVTFTHIMGETSSSTVLNDGLAWNVFSKIDV